jgi:hypothetical protein
MWLELHCCSLFRYIGTLACISAGIFSKFDFLIVLVATFVLYFLIELENSKNIKWCDTENVQSLAARIKTRLGTDFLIQKNIKNYLENGWKLVTIQH